MPNVSRSPNYPAVSLPVARELARRLYDREKRSPADPDQIVRAWGHTSLNGPSRTKLSALRKYGLLEETRNGFRLSDRAMAMLYPNDPQEEADALRDAALSPDLFRELAAFEGASDDNLVSRLVRLGFTPTGARAAVASYHETMDVVPRETTSYDASHEVVSAQAATGTGAAFDAGVLVSGRPESVLAGHEIVLNIALPGGARVDFAVRSGVLVKEAIQLLRSYLDLVELSISAPKAETVTAPSPSEDPSELEPLALQSEIAPRD
jgi:hypothetical protein